MSAFRIQQKKFEIGSRKKFYSEESKPGLEISKNLTQILNQGQQKTKSNINFKRRINTISAKDESLDASKIKRISQTYNLSKGKIQSWRNSNFNKKSLSGTKIDAILITNKNFELFKNREKRKLSPQHKHPNKSSPKFRNKVSDEFKSREKSKGKISNRLMSSSKYYLPQSITKRETKTNRLVSQELNQRLYELYNEGVNYYKKKNIVQALDSFLECLKIESSNSDCLYHIGSCYFNLKQAQASVQFLQRLRRVYPTYNTNLYLYLAINYKNLFLADESIKVLCQGVSYFPKFQQGFFYLGTHEIYQGKMYMKQQDYINAVNALQKCISLNQNNFLAKLTLADAYLQVNQQFQAIEMYKIVLNQKHKKTLDQRTHLSTHLKLIQLLIFAELYDDPWFNVSFQYCQTQIPQSPDLQFFKLLRFYEMKSQITQSQVQSVKFNLNFCINGIQNQKIRTECVKLMLRILIDTKDFYKAEDTLRMMQKQMINQKNLQEWRLLIEGANDIIKQKIPEGKAKLILCLERLDSVYKLKTSHCNLIQKPFKDYVYLKHQVLEYLGYVEFEAQDLDETLKIYEKIFYNDFQSLTEPEKTSIFRFRKRYSTKLKEIQINKIIVQSIKEHLQTQNYFQAKKGFSLALSERQTPQRLFMWVINQVAILKTQSSRSGNQKDALNETKKWSEVIQKLRKAEEMSPNFTLIFFFHSLILLYLRDSKRALQKVQKAIQKMEDPISEFHYIEGLCCFLISEQDKNIELAYQGLEGISRAIEIDSGIPQFFKERSKHYFCFGRYQDALRDIMRSQFQNNDPEAKLLSMFYHYLCGNYYQSQKIMYELLSDEKRSFEEQNLRQSHCMSGRNSLILESDFTHRYKSFEQALMFRLKKYSKTGEISKLLLSLTNQQNQKEKIQQLDFQYLDVMDKILKNRDSYSEFTIYLINLLMGVYFLYQKNLQMCMSYLFSCLAEIQMEEEYCFNNKIESMKMGRFEDSLSRCSDITSKTLKDNTKSKLCEVKYNVIITLLLKAYQQQLDHKNEYNSQSLEEQKCLDSRYKESLNFINSFITQSQSTELIESLQTIKKLILSSQRTARQKQNNQSNLLESNRISVYIKPYFQSEKLSDSFSDISIPIGDKYTLITKPIVFYPQQLRFSIKPEFDTGFLFNFGFDKIQNKLTPPWYKFTENSIGKLSHHMIFTDQLRNQSIAITSTTKQPSIISKHKQSQSRYRYFNESLNRFQKQQNNFQKLQQSNHKKEQQTNFKQNIKLDPKVQKKLQKLFHK